MTGRAWPAALLLALTSCGSGDEPVRAPAPSVGGPTPTAKVPSEPMGELERPIAARLARQLAPQGLHLDHLACPVWNQRLPAELTCTGWFDGVEGTVTVTLSRSSAGTVAFDAVLREGVIATDRLVHQLTAQGYDNVDCGDATAYAAVVGRSIVCSVARRGSPGFVRVMITDQRGAVTFTRL